MKRPRPMNYHRDWTDLRNAAGFAAECARLALPIYVGDRRSDVVAAIEIAERYVRGEQIDADDAARAYDAATVAGDATGGVRDGDGAYAAARAARDAVNAVNASCFAANASGWAKRASVDSSKIQAAYVRWVTQDLIGDRSLDDEVRQAAGAAIVAGDEELARELLQ